MTAEDLFFGWELFKVSLKALESDGGGLLQFITTVTSPLECCVSFNHQCTVSGSLAPDIALMPTKGHSYLMQASSHLILLLPSCTISSGVDQTGTGTEVVFAAFIHDVQCIISTPTAGAA